VTIRSNQLSFLENGSRVTNEFTYVKPKGVYDPPTCFAQLCLHLMKHVVDVVFKIRACDLPCLIYTLSRSAFPSHHENTQCYYLQPKISNSYSISRYILSTQHNKSQVAFKLPQWKSSRCLWWQI